MDLETLTQKFQSYSGLVLVLFIAVHLAGVTLAGINPDAFEIYASNLHSNLFLREINSKLSPGLGNLNCKRCIIKKEAKITPVKG